MTRGRGGVSGVSDPQGGSGGKASVKSDRRYPLRVSAPWRICFGLTLNPHNAHFVAHSDFHFVGLRVRFVLVFQTVG